MSRKLYYNCVITIMTEDQKREIIKTFLDINKPCEERDFNGCADLKKKYIEELNRPGGCSSCRRSSVRRKYSAFVYPRLND